MTAAVIRGLVVFLAGIGSALAAGDTAHPPSVALVKACIQQFDVHKQWHVEWRRIDIGPARHPQNPVEALNAFGGPGVPDGFGYPVHVAYSLRGLTDIDAVYWMIQDAAGHWQIPALCVLP
jgi:hypothetical protein